MDDKRVIDGGRRPQSRPSPQIPDHELLRRIGQGSYGEVWLARNAIGTFRAVKVVYRDEFADPRPYEREFFGMQQFEPLSRANEGFVDILQVGRNDEARFFYYIFSSTLPKVLVPRSVRGSVVTWYTTLIIRT
jgi:hypothetical protein